MNEEAKLSGSVERAHERAAFSSSPARVAPLTSVEHPPPYGAQHCQDALWKGGHEVLPPMWREFKVRDGATIYQDDHLHMTSWNRPLSGLRLESPGQLIPECEWHISPFGRSYFVNHKTRSTSWKKPTPERPAGSLAPAYIIKDHPGYIWSLACVGTASDTTSHSLMSASEDGSIRRWRRDGEPIGKPLNGDGGAVVSLALSPKETMVASGSADGKLRLWNVKEGRMVGEPWEGHNAAIRCISWSPADEVASGSEDGTIRRWHADTGRQIALPIETRHGWVNALRYSPQGDKFASGGADAKICVWSKDSELLIEINGHSNSVVSLCWSMDSANIFSGSAGCTIRKWRSIDGEELAVLRGHTNIIASLCLSLDERYLVSASTDCSVRIWDLESNQLVGKPLLHDDELRALAIFPGGKYFASAGIDQKIYLWDFEAALQQDGDQSIHDGKVQSDAKRAASSRDILSVSPPSKQQAKNGSSSRYGNDFWEDDTNRTSRRSAPFTSPSPPRRRNLFNFLRFNRPPVDASPPTPPQPHRRRFSLFSRGTFTPTVAVALAHDEDRYFVVKPTEAEMAAAMTAAAQHASGNQMSHGQAAVGPQGSQVVREEQSSQPIAQKRHYYPGPGEPSPYVIGCCGFYVHFVRRRST